VTGDERDMFFRGKLNDRTVLLMHCHSCSEVLHGLSHHQGVMSKEGTSSLVQIVIKYLCVYLSGLVCSDSNVSPINTSSNDHNYLTPIYT
jgi:hypothetical protein